MQKKVPPPQDGRPRPKGGKAKKYNNMKFTDYHAKYFAHELTKRFSSDNIGKLAGILVDAQVDLNPHQVEAALFAFHSPLSRGALLADEVGLGKTIEAGLVISQKWAERKRRILIITPANLRKQWHQELQEKFFLPCRIFETRSYNAEIKNGNLKPFDGIDAITICSYQFTKTKASDVLNNNWDLVVIDEAHRLRNVYKPSNVIAITLKLALANVPNKLLLTATPLQNSLLELFGLVSFIDERVFGDFKSFREQYSRLNDINVFESLKTRLRPVCHRTLRRQVTAYVPYTKRHPIVQPFTPEEGEDRLYNLVSDYLRRDNLQALPASQRSLMTLVLRKLLASSTFAIAGALESISNRLKKKLDKGTPKETVEDELKTDYEGYEETAEEWPEDDDSDVILSNEESESIKNEILDLESFRELAVSITNNAKGRALITALEQAFSEAERLGASRKAIIFTESRKTQLYLLRVLADSPFADGIVLFNGSNTDEQSKEIYSNWLERHKGTDKVTLSRTADMRSALVDYFREEGKIMIATEAGAEGINLQFCSLVVNYDLPWNPQRIEQRIGRCHRYGQKHDVVVVNFLNVKNEADQRVFQLLAEKFTLFEGVFGASDEVLGAIESGVDFEKRIATIYHNCRTPDEIKTCFDQLQSELSAQISDAMTCTRKQLLENFDEEVHEKLRVNMASSKEYRSRYEQILMDLTEFSLGSDAEFKEDQSSFNLKRNPFSHDTGILTGTYELPRRTGEAHMYRLQHPLAQLILQQAKEKELPPAEIVFKYDGSKKISILEPFIGNIGEIILTQFTVESLDQIEDYLIFSAISNDGRFLEEEAAKRLFSLAAAEISPIETFGHTVELKNHAENRKAELQRTISERNANFFEAEAEKLDNWADDMKVTLEREIKEIDKQIREAKRSTTVALSLEEKLFGQKQIRALESVRNTKRKALFEAQDEIDRKRDALIEEIEGKLQAKANSIEVFNICWSLI
jgi:superfamily II DNA or RNA helicase